MAKFSLLSALLIVFFFQICFARSPVQQQQQQNECSIRSINALEPTHTIQAEAGRTEFFDANNQQFQCAGVAVVRHTIRSRGLLLPSYTNSPLLAYVVQGRGIQGMMISGCPETFQSSQGSQQYEEGRGETGERGGQRFHDRHQKVENFRQGDVLAYPAGAAHWIYNDGERDLVVVVLFDTSNDANQLDQNQRRFFIAGNPQRGQEQEQQGQQGQGDRQQQQQYGSGNVLRGFNIETLTEVFGVNERTARKLQGQEDERGHIVRVEQGLQVIRPPVSRQGGQEEYPTRPRNGIEETICSAKIRQNIDEPSRADFYNPRAGSFRSINSFTLPILSSLQLSAERGVLHRNANFAPHWYANSHSVMYVTNGDARIQIVDHRGEAVFDGEVREGQIVVVPQNFAVVKRAGEQGFEWVGFNTNDNAMINTLAGRTSAIRGLPVDVIANSYQISREDAMRMKFSREETLIFESRSPSGRVASA